MRHLLYHTPGWDPTPFAADFANEEVTCQVVRSGADLRLDDRPAVLLIDPAAREQWPSTVKLPLADAGLAIIMLGAPGEADLPEGSFAQALSAFLPAGVGHRQLLMALRAGWRVAAAKREVGRVRAENALRGNEVTELTDIGVKLSTERNYNTLLETILTQARRLTQSDAGSLYVVETDDQGVRRLRFKLAQNQSRPDIPFVEFTIPIDQTSLAGYAAAEGEPLVIDDVYMLPPDVEYSFNRSFDERYGYRTRSVLSIPMTSHKGEVLGVLQLINRKRNADAILRSPAEAEREAMSYSPHTVKLVRSLAAQAGVAIENSTLYESIERLFEGFVQAAVTAIESRDPTTSGHSLRVATMTVGLARAVDRVNDGLYRNVRFSPEQIREIRYAGLLHDFGKVGVREQVLVKAKKLYPYDLSLIRQRQAFLYRTAQWGYEKARADFLERHGKEGYEPFLRELQRKFEEEKARLDRFLTTVLESNEPTVLAEGNFAALQEFAEQTYESLDGTVLPWLNDDETRYLSIRKGSLDEAERLEIESHVTHTYGFLSNIPWTKELQGIPDIAHGHHEKLNGTGYPRRVTGDRIPIQTRMMTISDIFDALTASDRPYKRALPLTRALDIIADEVKTGQLDGELFKVFVEAKAYEAKE
ncbi:MAG TPA: HD domain-containing phosphohydrolase [Gemmatimonadales bacterium]|nr:HD domain-containing phosphohydrolase [Gemmatimonadales bacterium]